MFKELHTTAPELEYWVLCNNLTNEEFTTTWEHLTQIYTENQLNEMMRGHNDYWFVYKQRL